MKHDHKWWLHDSTYKQKKNWKEKLYYEQRIILAFKCILMETKWHAHVNEMTDYVTGFQQMRRWKKKVVGDDHKIVLIWS